jgi:hypothetical protein
LKERYVAGYAPWPVAQHNSQVYIPKFLRNYWIGGRYYPLVRVTTSEATFTPIFPMQSMDYQLKSRFACFFPLNDDQAKGLYYEQPPGTHIDEIVFQCRKYFDVCCGAKWCWYEE